jgi:hypothetical protein
MQASYSQGLNRLKLDPMISLGHSLILICTGKNSRPPTLNCPRNKGCMPFYSNWSLVDRPSETSFSYFKQLHCWSSVMLTDQLRFYYTHTNHSHNFHHQCHRCFLRPLQHGDFQLTFNYDRQSTCNDWMNPDVYSSSVLTLLESKCDLLL